MKKIILALPVVFAGCGGDLPDVDFKKEMVSFVKEISTYAKSLDSSFLVFPQNAAELWSEEGYLDAVDGIGQEDTYYGYEEDAVATPVEVTAEIEQNLGHFRDAAKLVLTIDYTFTGRTEPSFTPADIARTDSAYSKSQSNGFFPYTTVRDLSWITINPGHEPEPNSDPIITIAGVHDFLYILQHDANLSRQQFLDSIGSLGFDLIVMDYQDDDGPYSNAEIAGLKQKSNALIIAYMSIGEAEDYRFYWKKEWNLKSQRPEWIEREDPSWPGNYLVWYWDPSWKEIIFGTDSSYLDAIISRGFDGVYLDKIDAYEEFLEL